MVDKLYQPAIGPTKNTEAADALDATVPNPEAICEPTEQIETILSSMLYPVAATDDMVFGIAFSSGWLAPLPNSDFTGTFGMEDGTYIQTRWFYDDGPYYSDFQGTFAMMDGSLINKLIEGDTPDESLQFSTTINNNCSMDLI